MKKLIVANWKANPDSLAKAISLAKKIEAGIGGLDKAAASRTRGEPRPGGREVVIAPPFPYLSEVGKNLRRAKLGAQDAFWRNNGPYTGEVGPAMLKNLGVEYAIVGHSERRRLCGETDEIINKKVSACLKAGLKVILCVGEPMRKKLEIRNQNLEYAKNYVKNQLRKDLKDILASRFQLLDSRLIIAYEPVWAISTAKNAKADKPEDALEMIRFIKGLLASRFQLLDSIILYGGSVDSRNAGKFLCYNEVDGALVGGASLKAEEFVKIIKASA